jgi:hypothetical protein
MTMELQDVKTVDIARGAHAERSIGAVLRGCDLRPYEFLLPLRQTTPFTGRALICGR